MLSTTFLGKFREGSFSRSSPASIDSLVLTSSKERNRSISVLLVTEASFNAYCTQLWVGLLFSLNELVLECQCQTSFSAFQAHMLKIYILTSVEASISILGSMNVAFFNLVGDRIWKCLPLLIGQLYILFVSPIQARNRRAYSCIILFSFNVGLVLSHHIKYVFDDKIYFMIPLIFFLSYSLFITTSFVSSFVHEKVFFVLKSSIAIYLIVIVICENILMWENFIFNIKLEFTYGATLLAIVLTSRNVRNNFQEGDHDYIWHSCVLYSSFLMLFVVSYWCLDYKFVVNQLALLVDN